MFGLMSKKRVTEAIINDARFYRKEYEFYNELIKNIDSKEFKEHCERMAHYYHARFEECESILCKLRLWKYSKRRHL